jgi:hypothetical protein
MADDGYERGRGPLSNGERRALEELRKIDKTAGKPYEDRAQRLGELRREADRSSTVDKDPRRLKGL